ncbi:MAG: oligosaccharide flippase family protein [Lacrimispora saccharolytica]
MKKRSLKKNALLNAIRQITSALFPLITVPYATRVLGAEHYGLVNFSASIINYFVLIAGLGISSYMLFVRGQESEMTKQKLINLLLRCLRSMLSRRYAHMRV